MIVNKGDFYVLKPGEDSKSTSGKGQKAPEGVMPWPPQNGQGQGDGDDSDDDGQQQQGQQQGKQQQGKQQQGKQQGQGEQGQGEQGQGEQVQGEQGQGGKSEEQKHKGGTDTKVSAKSANSGNEKSDDGAKQKGFGSMGDVLEDGALGKIIEEAKGDARNNTTYGPRETFSEGEELENSSNLSETLEDIVNDVFYKKGSGTGSMGVDRFVKDMTSKKIPWRDLLRNFVAEIGNLDYDQVFNRESVRRFASNEDPRLAPDRMDEAIPSVFNSVVICIDTSGSIGQKELSLFGAEIKSLCEDQPNEIKDLYIVYCDDRINPSKGVQRFDTKDDFSIQKMKPSGGGGTSFYPPFKWISEYDKSEDDNGDSGPIVPAFVVYFTDAEGDSPPAGDSSLEDGDGNSYEDRVFWIIIDHTEEDSYVKDIEFGEKVCITRDEI
ncbi:VWA-like domain-containing protein [bacterium]|jgi:hypothetical protein|nr:VWA-like domain-containing protein [bacterium]